MDDLQQEAEHIYCEWDQALSGNDIDTLLALYHTNATIESPLIPYLMKTKKGIVKGHSEIHQLLKIVVKRKPPTRKYYRKKFFTQLRRKAPSFRAGI